MKSDTMRKMKRIISLFMAFMLFVVTISFSYAIESPDPSFVQDEVFVDGGDGESPRTELNGEEGNDLLTDEPEYPTTIAVENIELDAYEETLYVGGTLSLTARVLPADATEQTIEYKSLNEAVATVSSTGTVTGISAGSVTIQLSAGGYVKTIDLKVEVKTSQIKINSIFIVLKPGETFQLRAEMYPSDATDKNINFSSLDPNIASVSSSGLVTAGDYGTTTITVSNKDCIASATVVVNQRTVADGDDTTDSDIAMETEKVYPLAVTAKEFPQIDSNMLKYLYETKQTLTVSGEGYELIISGDQIKNYNNELITDLGLHSTDDGLSLVLNDGESLCGKIVLKLENATVAEQLYLYNPDKDTYQEIRRDGEGQWSLTSAGTYMLSEQNPHEMGIVWWWMGVGGVAIFACTVIYIFIKKQYWFW